MRLSDAKKNIKNFVFLTKLMLYEILY